MRDGNTPLSTTESDLLETVDGVPVSRRQLMQSVGAVGGLTAFGAATDPAIGSSQTTVIVRAETVEPPLLLQSSSVVDELKATADNSQQPIIDYVEATEGLTVINRFWLANALLLEVDTTEIDLQTLQAQEGVKAVHDNFQLSIPDPVTPTSSHEPDDGVDTTYGLDQLGVPEAWDAHGSRGGGARIAVLDTGVDPDHPAIDIDNENFAEFDDSGEQIEDAQPHDSSYHGTHVSGTATGGEDESGTAIGVAPDATLLHGLILPEGGGTFAQIIGGMEWAVENDADVMNMSLGPQGGGYVPAFIEPVRNAEQAGTIVVSSSGNAGEGTSGSPANVVETTAVGATNADVGIAEFSSGEVIDTESTWGGDAPSEWPTEYIVPDVAAPGVEVLSAFPTDHIDGPYHQISGTSMASPHVAGVVGLIASVAQEEYGQATLMDAIRSTTWNPEGVSPDKDTRYGLGIVDAFEATGRVAASSGVTGTVTGPDGTPIDGATVDLAGFSVETDADGEYRIRAHPGEYSVSADAFGYTTTEQTVTVTDDSFTQLDFSLSNDLATTVVDGQPDGLEAGKALEVRLNVANVESVTVELAGQYSGGADLTIDGTEQRFGEPVTFDPPRSGDLPVTVHTGENGFGDLELDFVIEGLGETITLTTGPTSVFAEPVPIGVVDAETGVFTTDIVAMLEEELHERFQISTLTPSEARTAAQNRDHAAYVVQHLGSDPELIADFESVAAAPEVGVVYLDQYGSQSDAVSQLADVTGDPNETTDVLSQGIAPPVNYTVQQTHQLLDGIVEEGETVSVTQPDPVVSGLQVFGGFHTFYEGYEGAVAGTTLANTQAISTVTGSGFGVDDLSRTVVASSLGLSEFVPRSDVTVDGRAILGAAIEHAARDPQVDAIELPAERIPPGESTTLVIEVEELLELEIDVTNILFIDPADLRLTVDGESVAFGETITYDEPFTGEIELTISSETQDIGQFAFNTRFLAVGEQDREIETGVAFPPTTVYESPVNVPEQIDDLQVAVDFVQPGDDVVLADGTYEVAAPDRGFQTGLFIETPDITLRAADGANPEVIHAEDLPAPRAINIAADGVTVDGVNGNVIDGSVDPKNEIGTGVLVREGTSDVTVKNLTGAGTFGVLFESTTGVTVENVTAVDTVTGVGTDSSFFGTIEDATITGVTVRDSPDYSFSGGVVIYSGATNVTVTDCDIEIEDGDIGGVVLTGSFEGGANSVIRDNTVTGPGTDSEPFGVGNAGVVTDQVETKIENNDITDTYYGVQVGGRLGFGETNVAVRDNDIDVTGTGYYQTGDFVTVTENVIEASTGVDLGDGGFTGIYPDQALVRHNDLSATDQPFTGIPGERFFDPADPPRFDCRENYIGDRDYDDPIADGDITYDPFLTVDPDDADLPDPTRIATDVYLDPNTTYALGVPGPTDNTIFELLDVDGFRDFDGTLEYFNATSERWQQVTGTGELKEIDTLDAFKVTPSSGQRTVIDFRQDDDTPPGLRDETPGGKRLTAGWNVVTAPHYGSVEMMVGHDEIEAVDDPLASPGSQLGDAEMNAFTGYKVKATDQMTMDAGITEYAPTMTALYEGLGLDPTMHESPGVPGGSAASTLPSVETVLESVDEADTAVEVLTEYIGNRIVTAEDGETTLKEAVESTTANVADETPSTHRDVVSEAVEEAVLAVFESRFDAALVAESRDVDEYGSQTAQTAAQRRGNDAAVGDHRTLQGDVTGIGDP